MGKMGLGLAALPALLAAAAAVGESVVTAEVKVYKREEMRLDLPPTCRGEKILPEWEKFRDKPTRGPRRR